MLPQSSAAHTDDEEGLQGGGRAPAGAFSVFTPSPQGKYKSGAQEESTRAACQCFGVGFITFITAIVLIVTVITLQKARAVLHALRNAWRQLSPLVEAEQTAFEGDPWCDWEASRHRGCLAAPSYRILAAHAPSLDRIPRLCALAAPPVLRLGPRRQQVPNCRTPLSRRRVTRRRGPRCCTATAGRQELQAHRRLSRLRRGLHQGPVRELHRVPAGLQRLRRRPLQQRPVRHPVHPVRNRILVLSVHGRRGHDRPVRQVHGVLPARNLAPPRLQGAHHTPAASRRRDAHNHLHNSSIGARLRSSSSL